MGFILSKLRGKKADRREELEKIDKELREIQRFQYDTELTQKRMIGRLLIFSSVVYLASAAGFYFFAPRGRSWIERSLYIAPFVLFPLLIWLLKRGLSWYYKRKMVNNTDKYKQLKIEKQRLLEDVMEFETFNNAKQILEKFDPNRLLPKYLEEQQKAQSLSPGMTPATVLQESLRRRTTLPAPGSPISRNPAQTPLMRPIMSSGDRRQYMRQTMNPMQVPRPAIMPAPGSGGMSTPQQPIMGRQFSIQPRGPIPGPSYMLPAAPVNPVVHNRGSGWMDKLVDYVVGDGPANRYALICRYCATHNGLATPEDFPYTGYRCVFCHQFNPPRQVRPAAEKLPVNTVLIEEMEHSPAKTLNSSPRVTEDEGTTDDEAKSSSSVSAKPRDLAAGDSETPEEKPSNDGESEAEAGPERQCEGNEVPPSLEVEHTLTNVEESESIDPVVTALNGGVSCKGVSSQDDQSELEDSSTSRSHTSNPEIESSTLRKEAIQETPVASEKDVSSEKEL